MTDTLKVGLVQMTSTVSIDRNVELCEPMIREAAEKGAELIVLPEVANLVQKNRAESTKEAVTQDEDAFLASCRSLAEELGVWIHIGSLVVKLPGEERMANRGVMIDPTGAVVALYDKIHMFDVDLEGGESYRESKLFKPGEEAVLVDTPWGGYGMAICYDMRFPYLFRDLAHAGARVLAIPAAFTRPTGRAHWHTLLRARAIETGCFVIAAAQTGEHEDGRETYGHSIAIDPWGEVLADAGEAPGVTVVDLDLSRVDTVRGMVPSLRNGRPYAKPTPIDVSEAAE
jgi:predicted amidohydrolase